VRKAIELFLMTGGDEEADEDEDEEDCKKRADEEKEKKVKYAKQVINLGSGYDTSWWCLVGSKKSFTNRVKWYDVDFAEVIRRKIKTIEKHEALREPLGVYHFERDGSELRSTSGYNLVSADLRDAEELKEMLTEARVDWQLPTLFVTEVALSYLNREKCEKVLRLCATFNGDKSSDSDNIKVVANKAIVSYEAMRLNDEFGRRMCKNVREQRGTPFLALEEENGSHVDCASVEAMLVRCGFDAVKCRKMTDCQDVLLSREEIYRAERLEMLDEREEFNLIQSHYGVSIGVRGDYFARTFRRWLT
jgi:O-methyltransferase involved in polyketide biosynthesis